MFSQKKLTSSSLGSFTGVVLIVQLVVTPLYSSIRINGFLSNTASQAYGAEQTKIGIGSAWAPELRASDKLRFLKKLINNIKSQSRHSVVQDSQIFQEIESMVSAEPADQAKILVEARKLLESGKKAYKNLKLKEAKKNLGEARRLLIKNLNLLESGEELIESHLFLGMAFVATNETARALNEFKRAALLDPELVVETPKFSPDVVATYEAARQEVDQQGKSNVLLNTRPNQAKVFVNGKLVGSSPLNLVLPRGDHFFSFYLSQP